MRNLKIIEQSDSTEEKKNPETKKLERLTQKEAQLEKACTTLKAEFIGLEHEIDKITQAIKTWFLLPEAMKRPTVIGLWGTTGVGKTSLVNRYVELLGLGLSLIHI